MNKGFERVLEILPKKIADVLREKNFTIEEIRIRAGAPIYVYSASGESLLYGNNDIIYATIEDINCILKKVTGNSLYAFNENIKCGFITIENGHRIGICGKAVYENKKLISIKEISGINIRCANEIKGVAEKLVEKIFFDNTLKNTLIVSPPKCGKTTVLRELTRILSKKPGIRIALIDERDEIAATAFGISANDIGDRTFVLSGYLKKDGFSHAIRALSPTLILCDEIGEKEDFSVIEDALVRGVKIIATLHGERGKSIPHGFEKLFERVVFLDKNFEQRVYSTEGENFIEC